MLVCSRCSKAGCIILSYGLRTAFRGIYDETKYERTLVRVSVTAAMGTLHKTGRWNIPIIFVLIPVCICLFDILTSHTTSSSRVRVSAFTENIPRHTTGDLYNALVRCMGPELWFEPLWQPFNKDLYLRLTNPLHEIDVYCICFFFVLFVCLKIGFMGFLLFRGI